MLSFKIYYYAWVFACIISNSKCILKLKVEVWMGEDVIVTGISPTLQRRKQVNKQTT